MLLVSPISEDRIAIALTKTYQLCPVHKTIIMKVIYFDLKLYIGPIKA